MDVEDDNAIYLNYLNDPSTTNNYLLGNNVELSDALPFSEIGTTDWPPETFPILLNASFIAECNTSATQNNQIFTEGEVLVQTIGIQTDENGSEELLNALIPVENNTIQAENMTVVSPKIVEQDEQSYQSPNPQTSYVNYSPIVKENADGNKEIYLTEKDINNDASVIQLFNTDGSIITIDKSLLNTLNCPKKNGISVKQNPRDYTPHYSAVIANKCKICNELFVNEKDIRRHLDQKHAEIFHQEVHENVKPLFNNLTQNGNKYTIFLCSICHLAFSERECLKQHMINDHQLSTTCIMETEGDKTESDPKLDEKKSVKTLANILIRQQEKARKKYVCSINNCKLRFPNKDILKKHEDCHVGENRRQFICNICDQKFSIWRICSNHYWKMHRIDFGLFSCPICDQYKHNSSAKVMEHMAVHNEDRPFLCSECGKGYKTMVQLRNHEILHKKTEDAPKWSTMRRCDICERYFASAKCLKNHIQSVHENFKPFVCNICGHKTTRKAMLELHIRQHTGQKPHECSYCTYRTGDPNCLRRHVMKHIGLRKYKCPHCLYTAIQSSSLKSHMMRRHPGKGGTYRCNYCSYSSINMSNYISHLKTHEIALKATGSTTNHSDVLEISVNNTSGADVENEETETIFAVDNTIQETLVDSRGVTIPAELKLVPKE